MKFKATNKKTGEEIEFRLEDLACTKCDNSASLVIGINKKEYRVLQEHMFTNWLENYILQYYHQGKYYDYE